MTCSTHHRPVLARAALIAIDPAITCTCGSPLWTDTELMSIGRYYLRLKARDVIATKHSEYMPLQPEPQSSAAVFAYRIVYGSPYEGPRRR